MSVEMLTVNNLTAQVHLPDAPEGGGKHSLPPGNLQSLEIVDEYPGCPANWEHGSSIASSYFMKMTPGKHLWFDFRHNAANTHEVAIVASIQGINPITGQHTKVLNLQQFKKQCPKHKIDFKQDRYCEKCDYKWPAQNYMTTTAHPRSHFWIDGFRSGEGEVKGFLITEESLRGVAAQLIGKDRVWAIGLAFYLSKKPKPSVLRSRSLGFADMSSNIKTSNNTYGGSSWNKSFASHEVKHEELTSSSIDVCMNFGSEGADGGNLSADMIGMNIDPSVSEVYLSGQNRKLNKKQKSKKIEIAAGSTITQELDYPDPNSLDYWQEEPAGMIYVNHCDEIQFKEIISKGKKDLSGKGKGFLQNVKTGN